MTMGTMLILNARRTPAGVALEQRRLPGGTFRIGRGSDSDWVLPDPDRVLSKCHCLLSATASGWTVTDRSSNGTRLNGHVLDPDVPRALHDGDILAFGAYEIEARLRDDVPEDEARVSDLRFGPSLGGGRGAEVDDPFAFLEPDGEPADQVRDPLDEIFEDRSEIAADRASDLAQHFRPPRPTGEIIPADWDEVIGTPPGAPPALTPEASALRPEPPPPPPPLVAQPLPAQPSADGAAAGFAALAAGAGLDGAACADPDAALRSLGAAFRALVVGLRQAMIARATIKSEFRIEQTMIRSFGNNPLKFAADDEDALAALLGVGRRVGMSADRAVGEALRDMRIHELAVASAMQTAVREMLAELAPARVEATVEAGHLDAFGRRDRRRWDAYVARHRSLLAALDEDFDSIFGRAFVRAYESASGEINAAQDDGEDRRRGVPPGPKMRGKS